MKKLLLLEIFKSSLIKRKVLSFAAMVGTAVTGYLFAKSGDSVNAANIGSAISSVLIFIYNMGCSIVAGKVQDSDAEFEAQKTKLIK